MLTWGNVMDLFHPKWPPIIFIRVSSCLSGGETGFRMVLLLLLLYMGPLLSVCTHRFGSIEKSLEK